MHHRRSRVDIDLPQLRAAAMGRAPREAASLVDAARAAALNVLGDTEGAVRIAQHMLRAEMDQ